MFPRQPGCSVVEGKDITEPKVKRLAKAADDCWQAIMSRNLDAFAEAFKASFEAQISMFPGMVNPSGQKPQPDGLNPTTVQGYIDRYSHLPGVLAWKMPGAGGGGYLVLVCTSRHTFPQGAIEVTIRRGGM